jgi:curli biogenesis system outer membrane secretion channel CsgG
MNTKIRFLLMFSFTCLLLSLPLQTHAGAGIKHRVIVGDFEMKADSRWYHGPKPGEGMADMLTTALMKSGEFRVYERAALNELLAERNLSMSNLADPSAEVSGMIEIADILVKGVITEFGYKEGKVGGGIAKLGGRAGIKNYEGRVAVDLRVISVGTGEVLWADTVADSESSKSLSMSNRDFSFGDQKSYDETVVGKATRKVINRIVKELGEQTRKLPWSGILIVADDLLFIDAGTEIGLAPGMEFSVKRMTKEVKHPKTGKILKRVYADLGVLKATEVEEGVTTVVAVSGNGFETGDLITLK